MGTKVSVEDNVHDAGGVKEWVRDGAWLCVTVLVLWVVRLLLPVTDGDPLSETVVDIEQERLDVMLQVKLCVHVAVTTAVRVLDGVLLCEGDMDLEMERVAGTDREKDGVRTELDVADTLPDSVREGVVVSAGEYVDHVVVHEEVADEVSEGWAVVEGLTDRV